MQALETLRTIYVCGALVVRPHQNQWFRELLIAKIMKPAGAKLNFTVLKAWLMESLIETCLLRSAACF